MRLKQYVIGVLMVFTWHVTIGQGVRPDQFTELTNPTNENFETYSQKNGLPRRVSFNNLRKAFQPQVNPVSVAFFPMTSGNLTNLGQFVTDPGGALWYIDGQGNAVNFVEALVDYVADSIQVSMIDSVDYIPDTLYIFVGDTVFKTEIIAGGGGGGSSEWNDNGPYLYPSEADTVYIPDTFPFGPPGSGVLNVKGRLDLRFPNSGGTSMAIGRNTLKSLTSGIENMAIGTDALMLNTEGSYNTGIGLGALGLNRTGSSNYAIGIGALYGNNSGNGNVAIGASAILWNAYGSGNVAIGSNAGENLSGSGNIMLGDSAGWYEVGDNTLYLDNGPTTAPLIYGDLAADSLRINGYLGFTQNAGNATGLAGLNGKYFTSVTPGVGLDLNTNVLSVSGSGSDSLYQVSDSLCFIVIGDTTCVPLDSVIYYDTEVCYWIMGDTTCLPFVNTGINIYNSNGALTGNRVIELGSYFLRMAEGGVSRFNLNPNTTSPGALLYLGDNYTLANQAILSLNNLASSTHSDAFMKFGVTVVPDRTYSMGVDRSLSAFAFGEGDDLSTNPVWRYHGTADSLVFLKQIKPWAGILDRQGDIGTPGQFLSSTGSGLDWVTGAGDHDWYESGATPPNSITDAMYHTGNVHVGDNTMAQTGAFNVQGLMKMRATSSNTSIFLGGGNLTLSGSDNIAIGVVAGEDLTSANHSVFLGFGAGRDVTTGNSNVLIGREAGLALVGGAQNVVVGGIAGPSNDYSSAVVVGYGAGTFADADSSTLVGYYAGRGFINGGHRGNTILGYYAGYEMIGSGNVYIGKRAGYGLSNSNRLVIDNDGSSEKFITGDFAMDTLRINASLTIGDDTKVNGRLHTKQGADIASVAGAVTLGGDGNSFEITGTNAITLISNVGWQNGSVITLVFTSTASMVNNTATSGNNITLKLGGGANFNATADDTITLILTEVGGVQAWREISRSAN